MSRVKSALTLGTVAFATILAAPAAFALPVYDQPAPISDYTGSRSTPSANGLGSTIGGTTTLSWVIDNGADPNDGLYHYSYTLQWTAQQGISHFILDLSDDCSATTICIQNLTLGANDSYGDGGAVYGTFSGGGSDPGMPGTITGIKLYVTTTDKIFQFSFDSDRVPVWGDFYAKGGNGTSNGFNVWNVGDANHSDVLPLDFIVRPDSTVLTEQCLNPNGCGNPCPTCVDVPEPESLPLLLSALAAASMAGGWFGAARQKRQAN